MQEDSDSLKIVKIFYKLRYDVQSKTQSFPWINQLCRASQMMVYIIVSVLAIIGGINMPTGTSSLLITLRGVFISILLLLIYLGVLVTEHLIFNELGRLQKHKSLSNIIGTLIIVTIYIGQMLFTIFVCYYAYLIKKSSFLGIQLFFLIASVPYILVQLFVFNHQRLFSIFSIILPILLVNLQINLFVFILFSISVFLIYKQNCKTKKLKYCIVIITCIWVFQQYSSSGDNSNIIATINLGLIIIAGSVCYLLTFDSPFLSSPLQEDKLLVNLYRKKGKNDVDKDGEKYKERVQLWDDNITRKTLWEKIKYDKENDPSFEMNLFYFRSGIILKQNIPSLMKEMLQFFEKTQGISFNQKYQMYKVSHQIFEYYGKSQLSSQNSTNIADIVAAQFNYHKFYKLTDELLVQIAQFWKQIVVNKYKITSQAQEKLGQITQLQRQLNKTVNFLSQYKIQKQIKIFKLVNQIVNSYNISKSISNQDGIKIQRSSTFQYMIVQNDKINRISLKLLKSLGYQNEQMQKNFLKNLVVASFQAYLQQICTQFLQKNQNRQFILPIINRQGCIVLKKCQLYIVPQYSTSVRYLITLQNLQLNNQLFFLYNATKQKIEQFNHLFKNFIGLTQQKFKQICQQETVLFASDVFENQLNQTQLTILTNHEVYKTKMSSNIQNSIKKNNTFNDDVTMHMDYQFKFANCHYLAINVQSQSFRQLKIQAQASTTAVITNKQKNLHEQYAKQKFFCKIQNPYKSKIIQKISNIKNRTYQSFFYQLIIIKLFLIVIVYINIGLYKYFSGNNSANMLSKIQSMFDLNNQYIYLLRMYSNSYSRYYYDYAGTSTSAFANKTLLKNKAKTNQELIDAINNLKNYHISTSSTNAKNLMNNHYQKDYRIQFNNFVVDTNTKLTTFYDFIIQIDQGYKDNTDIKFLSTNLNDLIKIMPVYKQFQQFAVDYKQSTSTQKILQYCFIGFVVSMIAVSLFMTLKMTSTHNDIKSLYNFIDQNDINLLLQAIHVIKKQIGQVVLGQQKSKNKHSYEQVVNKSDFFPKSTKQIYSQSTLDNKQNKNRQIEQTNSNNCRAVLQNSIKFLFFCPIVTIFSIVLSLIELNQLQTYEKDFYKITNLLQKYQVDQMWVEIDYIGLFQKPYYEQYLTNYSLPYDPLKIFKNQFMDSGLPSNFINQVNKQQALCKPQYLINITIPYYALTQSQCSSIDLSIFQKGYSQSLQYYATYIRYMTGSILPSQYLSKQPVKFSYIIFMKEILREYLKNKKDLFNTGMKQYSDYVVNNDMNIILSALAASIFLLVLVTLNAKGLKIAMDTTIDLICIIPTSAMYKIKMTNYMRRQGLLSKMDKL